MKDSLKDIIKNKNFYNLLEYIDYKQFVQIVTFLKINSNNLKKELVVDYLEKELNIKNLNDVYYYLKFNLIDNERLKPNHDEIFTLLEMAFDIKKFFIPKEISSKLVLTEPKILDLNKFYPETYLEIIRLISSSKNSIKILTAFIEPEIIKEIFKELEKKILENPNYEIKICIGHWKNFHEEVSNTKKSIKWIFDNYKSNRNYTIRYFKKRLDEKINSTHAKLIIADNEKAYFGSANLTQSSMKNSFELGIISNEDYVKDLVEIFNNIWESGKNVPKFRINE